MKRVRVLAVAVVLSSASLTGVAQPPPCTEPVTPASVMLDLDPGQNAVIENKCICLSPIPPRIDVVIAVDLSGSMGGEVANLKAEIVDIMNILRAGTGSDIKFGLVSYDDYREFYNVAPPDYESCGYHNYYGYPNSIPYQVNAAIGATDQQVINAVNAMVLRLGADHAESYARVMWEAGQANSTMNFRPGALRILVNFGDGIPHDCNVFEGTGCTASVVTTGVDPGRDNRVNTADDIDLQDDAIPAMIAMGVKLISIYSGTSTLDECAWNSWAQQTGGAGFRINADGTIPGGVDLPTLLFNLIAGATTIVNDVRLVPDANCPLEITFEPPFAGPIDVSDGATVCFRETIRVPADVVIPPSGTVCCTVRALADGVEIGTQEVCVTFGRPPVCNAGGPYTVTCGGATTTIPLDGSASFDPDQDTLTYQWTTNCSGASFSDPSIARPVLTLPTAPGCNVNCTVTLTISDGVLPPVSCNANVSVTDPVAPVFTTCTATGGEVLANCTYDLPFAATVTDNCGILADAITVTPSVFAGPATLAAPSITRTQVSPTEARVSGTVRVSGVTNCSAQIRITFNATDRCGRAATACVANATVADATLPVFTACTATASAINGTCGGSVSYSATVADNCSISAAALSVSADVLDGMAVVGTPTITRTQLNATTARVTGTVPVSGLVDCSATVRITVNAVDRCNNAAIPCVATAVVSDTTAPQISACSAQTANTDATCAATMNFSVTVNDNCGVDPQGLMVTPTLTAGNATFGTPSYTAEPLSPTQTRFVGTLPITELMGCAATVRLTFVAQDRCGRASAACNATAQVRNTAPLIITCPGDIVVDRGDLLCDADWSDWLDSVTVMSECNRNVTITHSATGCGFPPGSTTTVVWTARDDCGNTASCSANITVLPGEWASTSNKGSLLVFPAVELRWNEQGDLIQDAYINLLNDYTADVEVQLYFVNGETPVAGEPGWNRADNRLVLTANQSLYWSAATGQPIGLTSFTVLDPGDPPGRPDPDHPGQRMLRGFILAWAVNTQHQEIRWNHLSGSVMHVDYAAVEAWDYPVWAFRALCVDHGEQPVDCTQYDANGVCCDAMVVPGRLGLDGFEYNHAPDQLLLDFFASGGLLQTAGGLGATVDTDLTLMPASVDLRQDSTGPVVTRAEFAIWNENEVAFSGQARCVNCWDQTLLSRYGEPRHFTVERLQTNKGKARINGVAGPNCIRSAPAALLSVAERILFLAPSGKTVYTGGTPIGEGRENAVIRYDVAP